MAVKDRTAQNHPTSDAQCAYFRSWMPKVDRFTDGMSNQPDAGSVSLAPCGIAAIAWPQQLSGGGAWQGEGSALLTDRCEGDGARVLWPDSCFSDSDCSSSSTGERAPFRSVVRRVFWRVQMTGPLLAIDTRGLTKTYGRAAAVDCVDLQVPAGGVYALLGTNGAGKTTTVRMLSTLVRPDAGTARVFGLDVVAHAGRVRSLIGVTGQYASVDEDLTATENLTIFARLVGASRRQSRGRADELLAEFGLGAAADRAVRHFSGGMRRRLDLAASMITRPRLLFLDEPTTGLDPRTRQQMWQTVRRMVADGSTVLLTTQYLEEADQLADRVAVMDHGRIVADGTADELKARIGDNCVRLDLRDPDLAPAAAAVCAVFAQEDVLLEEAERRVMVPMPDLESLPEMLLALRAAQIELVAVNVERPTLDEVFFALTGDAEPGVAA